MLKTFPKPVKTKLTNFQKWSEYVHFVHIMHTFDESLYLHMMDKDRRLKTGIVTWMFPEESLPQITGCVKRHRPWMRQFVRISEVTDTKFFVQLQPFIELP